MAQDLGLNRNCDHWNISPEERERRKRVFWCCFIVDRITSAIYGRSSNFEERDCDVPFPSVDDDECITSKDSSRPPARLLEVFIQSIKICDILGHVLKNIYYAKARQHTSAHHIDNILTTLNRQLNQWHTNLPIALQYKLPNTQAGEMAPDPPSAICQLHLIYYTTLILLHRSFIPGPTQTQSPNNLPSFRICESAATSVLDIINIMLGENHLKYVYNFSVFFVFTAGIIFIKLASSDDASTAFDARININRIMRALDELEITWLNAARCCNILGELAGLRDIKLECDKFVPKEIAKPSPPPSIAVPNSPELSSTILSSSPQDMEITMQYNQNNTAQPMDTSNDYNNSWSSHPQKSASMSDYSHQQHEQPQRSSTDYFSHNAHTSTFPIFASSHIPISSVRSSSAQNHRTSSSPTTSSSFLNNTSPTMDPFAAPGIIPTPASNQAEQFDPLGTAFWGMPTSLDTDEWNAYFGNQQVNNTASTSQPTPTNQLSSMLLSSSASSVSSFMYSQQPLHRLSSTSSASMDLPNSPSQSFLLGFLDENKNSRLVSSPSPINATTIESNVSADIRYW